MKLKQNKHRNYQDKNLTTTYIYLIRAFIAEHENSVEIVQSSKSSPQIIFLIIILYLTEKSKNNKNLGLHGMNFIN